MLSFVLASLHILAYITYVWQQAVVCWVLSALQGEVLFFSRIGSTLYSIKCAKQLIHWNTGAQLSQFTQIPNKHSHLFQALPSDADSFGCVCQGFEISAIENYSANPIQ